MIAYAIKVIPRNSVESGKLLIKGFNKHDQIDVYDFLHHLYWNTKYRIRQYNSIVIVVSVPKEPTNSFSIK